MSLEDYEFNTETHPIICTDCGSPPSLVSLDKNSGTVVACDCDDNDPGKSLDSVPYEYATHHLPEAWEVVEDDESDDGPARDPNQCTIPRDSGTED